MKKNVVRKGLVLGIIVLFVGAGVIPSTIGSFEKKTVFTNSNSRGYIQNLIDNASNGDTIYIPNGTYYENIIINKPISLIGEDKDTTIIYGNGSTDVVDISVDWINISGFTIRNSGLGWHEACIRIDSNYNTISNCIFTDCYDGLYLINVYSSIIKNNLFVASLNNSIELFSSNNNILLRNVINNSLQGVALWSSSNNTISNNIMSNNYDGIYFINSRNNTIIDNNITSNNHHGISFSSSSNSNNNIIYHNNFINNAQNAYDIETNTWDNGYPFGGNYWGDYAGDDLYSGPNQDIPGSDGIGDTPYNISGGDNLDRYPLMHPFELYYILNISAPSEVNEGELFNVIVTSIGGTVIPDAIVEFNDELKLTDSDGRVYFTAPQVGADTYYNITVIKEGHTGDTDTILVKDVPDEFVSTFIFGRLDDLTTAGEIITLEALNIRAITFFPFTFNHYVSGELITISKDYFGLVGARFIFAFCGLSYESSKISMNMFASDNSTNTIIWLVSDVEGNPVETKDVEMILLNESGEPQTDAEITFNEVTGEGYINPGDTFTVVAPSDGYYVFMLTHKISGATIYKSSLTHY